MRLGPVLLVNYLPTLSISHHPVHSHDVRFQLDPFLESAFPPSIPA